MLHTKLADVSLIAGGQNWLAWIAVGALAGWITSRLFGGPRSLLGSVILGIIGALVSAFIATSILTASLTFFPSLIVAIIGAFIVNLLASSFLSRSSPKLPLSSTMSSAPQKAAYHTPLAPQPAVISPAPAPLYTAPPVRAASGPPRLFVSHSHTDNVWCREFVDALKVQGCDVWYDEQELGGGVVWQKRIVEEIQGRPVFVVVLLPEATSSQWVDEEIQLAISARRSIIPVHHRTTTIDGFLRNSQIVDVRGQSGQAAASIVANAAKQLVARS